MEVLLDSRIERDFQMKVEEGLRSEQSETNANVLLEKMNKVLHKVAESTFYIRRRRNKNPWITNFAIDKTDK